MGDKMTETGTLLQDRYLIEKEIGVGGMGAVYLAVDQRFDNYVAIKETFYSDDEFGEAFEREARLLNGLQHPVLPHVSDFFTENNGHFLVMQYIEGEDLSETLKREGAFPVEDVLRWTDNLLDALDYLHSQNPPVIHRDIKPQNLKLTPRGGIILLDFGLAKLKHEDTTGVKSVFGYSRRYSPLEQIQGTGTDARSDIFSLGATVYHLITGKQPIDVLARATKIIAGQPDPLQLASEINDKVPIEVAVVLHSALALNPDQRFVSADAMRKALEHASKIDSGENAEKTPETALAVAAASGNQIISPLETENFPALEAFVDEVKNAGQLNDNQPNPDEIPIQNADAALSSAENLRHSTVVIDAPTVASAGFLNHSRFQTAALAAVLTILAGIAAGYFIYQANSSENSAETPVVQSSPESKLNNQQTAKISDPENAGTLDSPSAKDVEQAKNKLRSTEKTAEREETSDKRDIIEEPFDIAVATKKPETVENSRPASVRNTGRSKSENDDEPRVRESEPAPDIESIFTGRSSWENDRKQQRRQERRRQQDEMSEEEFQELRRERRERRKKRQNEKPFPF